MYNHIILNTRNPSHLCLSLLFLVVSIISHTAIGHGLLNFPQPRGVISARSRFTPFDPSTDMFPSAPIDHKPHFPAGDKSGVPGSGLRSQIAAYDGRPWAPYAPYSSDFKWRAGVCGDPLSSEKPAHEKGGQYYYDGAIVKTYLTGDKISVSMSVVAHHNGFMELHLCDTSRCENGDISASCFHNGGCVQLRRAANPMCDDGQSTLCGPVDRNYPGRWYLPCEDSAKVKPIVNANGEEDDGKTYLLYGGTGGEYNRSKAIQYLLPENFACEHCVLQWYWTAANTCNPPGVVEYFEGEDAPKAWGNCKGQAGARGGYTKTPLCGRKFPEEYYMCADIRIVAEPPVSVPV